MPSIIRELMEQSPDWSKINIRDTEALRVRYKNSTAAEAVVYVALTKAIAGDVAAMRWLSKTGYGDKLTVDGEISHEGIVIYKPEKYPRTIIEVTDPAPVAPQSIAPAADQPVAPPPAPNPDFDGIA